MTWDEAVAQHESMWKAKEAGVPRDCISVCTYDDRPSVPVDSKTPEVVLTRLEPIFAWF